MKSLISKYAGNYHASLKFICSMFDAFEVKGISLGVEETYLVHLLALSERGMPDSGRRLLVISFLIFN
jgi:hypothetical protein